MVGRKVCFYGEMWLIIPKLSLLPLLSGALKYSKKLKGVFIQFQGKQLQHFLPHFSIGVNS